MSYHTLLLIDGSYSHIILILRLIPIALSALSQSTQNPGKRVRGIDTEIPGSQNQTQVPQSAPNPKRVRGMGLDASSGTLSAATPGAIGSGTQPASGTVAEPNETSEMIARLGSQGKVNELLKK